MKAIIKKELLSYFSSAIGYVYLAVFCLFGGFYFFATSLLSNSASLNYVFFNLFTIVAFLIPILTMRLISEEKKQKTDQALLTAPISITAIVFGKYIGACLMYLIGISITLVYGIIISFFTMPQWPVIIGSFIGLYLLGSTLIAICMFLSSLTENQIIAAICGLAVGLFVLLSNSIASIIQIPIITDIIKELSFIGHYNNFTMGIISLVDLVFFLSISALFIFLTIRIFEKRRFN